MSRFLNLCACEFTKVIKKKSTKVMLIILIISLFVSAGVTVLTKKVYNFSDSLAENMDYKSSIQAEIDTYKHELQDNTSLLDDATKNEKQALIDIYQIALDNNINIYNSSYWRADALNTDIYSSKLDIYKYKNIRDTDSEVKEQAKLDKMIDLIRNDDFSGFINYQKESTKKLLDEGIINQEDYDQELYILNLKEKYEIGKVYNANEKWKSSILDEISILKINLLSGIDSQTGKSLTEKTLKKTEDNIKIDEYRLEHNMQPFVSGVGDSVGSTRKIYDYMVGSIAILVLTVMMIIIAGTSISTEISKGTIKFWSFTPNKRWKILLSKLLAATFILVITTIVMSLISTVIGNIFFGSKNAQDYLYVSNGTVHTINYVLFSILYNLTAAIEIFVFIVFALMLSTVARNSAVSVGLSIATYLGGATIMQIINIFVKSDWTKFIPFNNLSLTDRIFTSDVSYTASSMVSNLTANIPVSFSFAVLGVCVLIMIVTMFDSFRKRDIV